MMTGTVVFGCMMIKPWSVDNIGPALAFQIRKELLDDPSLHTGSSQGCAGLIRKQCRSSYKPKGENKILT